MAKVETMFTLRRAYGKLIQGYRVQCLSEMLYYLFTK